MQKLYTLAFILLLAFSNLYAFDGERKGFIIGGGIGVGYLSNTTSFNSFSDTDSRAVFLTNFKIGYAPSNTLEIYYISKVSWWGQTNEMTGSGITFTLGLSAIAATVYIDNTTETGWFSGPATFGDTSLPSSFPYGQDMFILKYDGDGNFLWVEQAGATSNLEGVGIATDGSDNSIVTGRFFGTATFGNTTLTGAGGNIFIAKYDGDGNFLWVEQAGGTDIYGSEEGNAIATDGSGNCIVTGDFGGTATFGDTTLTSAGGDIFIAKYDGDGNFLRVVQAGGTGTGDGDGKGIATDGLGNSIVIGDFGGTATFGDTTLTSVGVQDIFIAKLGLVTAIEEEFALPQSFNLSQNYPNPFNPSTTISYSVPETEFVTIKVYDVLGNEVATLVNEEKPAGSYEINFNASNLPDGKAGLSSGIYFYRLQANDFTQIKKMIYLK